MEGNMLEQLPPILWFILSCFFFILVFYYLTYEGAVDLDR